ncbi:hypothetical protein Q3G72_020091 [Acer saccharum]|nr:hypothetical protein Q3G72_020091 [Acer saccharum]
MVLHQAPPAKLSYGYTSSSLTSRGLMGTMCLLTGRPMPERRWREEATDLPTTPFAPMIRTLSYRYIAEPLDIAKKRPMHPKIASVF